MKIAIIGSGVSGLTAIKCCLDEGLQPVCFEKEYSIGGLWRYEDGPKEGATVYKSTVINTSKEMMCFSDFPIPQEFPNYMHNSKVYEYFQLYAERFDLKKHIKFGINVLSCVQAEDFSRNGRWKVTTETRKTNESCVEYFDGILVCVGHHAIPNYPLNDFPGIERFKGKYMHSHDYRNHKGFEDKKVVVIGIGNSGGDIAVELSRHCKQVYLSTRRGTWVLNRVHHNGMPGDINVTTRINAFKAAILPASFLRSAAEKQMNRKFDHAKYGLKPNHSPNSQHPNICDDLPNRIITGSIRVKSNVERFTERTAVFDDGTEEEVDAVVFATGYSFQYPFLGNSILKVEDNECDLYKYMWPVTLKKHTLAIIGGVQPRGAVNTTSEMQSRWATRVFKGLSSLPNKDIMMEDIKRKRHKMAERYVKSKRHTLQVDYIDYMDQIAAEVCCKPNIWKYVFTDPSLAYKLIFGPAVPYQYRLNGPGSWPEARHMTMTVMDRVHYPLKTRKVVEKDQKSGVQTFLMLLLTALLLSWFLNWI